MNKQIIFIAIYRALDCLADETGNIELAAFLDKVNPYVFEDRKSADPAIYSEYDNWFGANVDNVECSDSYAIAEKYISEKTNYSQLFADISREEWSDLIDLIKQEEPQLLANK